MNGKMILPAFRNKKYTVFGGPYRSKPQNMRGVKMAVEINLPCDVDVPTRDFSVPTSRQLIAGVEAAIDIIASGEPLYVGCMGGIGRTGLFLAALAKAWGIENPIFYVRSQYIPHAVETKSQMDLINDLKFPRWLKYRVILAKLRGFMPSRTGDLTRYTIAEPARPRYQIP